MMYYYIIHYGACIVFTYVAIRIFPGLLTMLWDVVLDVFRDFLPPDRKPTYREFKTHTGGYRESAKKE